MSSITLTAQVRDLVGRKTNKLRVQGLVPAIAYGPALSKPMNLSVERNAFVRLFKEAGESTIVELQIEKGSPLHVLIQDIQVDPMRGEVTHVDFRAIDMNKPVETSVKLVFTGDSAAVKSGGTLVHALASLKIRALPKNLPHELFVDVSKLATFEDTVRVKDLVVPTGVQILEHAEVTVALVEAPRTEEEMAALNQAVDIDVTKVEVAKKEKVVEEGAVEGEAAAKPDAKAKPEAAAPKAKK